MRHEYLFDLTLACSVRVCANSIEEGKRKLTELLDCASANLGELDGEPVVAEVSLWHEPAAIRLIEVDGESSEDDECRKCGESSGNGEGWDGLCGSCANREEQEFLNYYRCPQCGFKWEDVWTATCDDDCSNCGCRHISPYKSEDFEGEEQGSGSG